MCRSVSAKSFLCVLLRVCVCLRVSARSYVGGCMRVSVSAYECACLQEWASHNAVDLHIYNATFNSENRQISSKGTEELFVASPFVCNNEKILNRPRSDGGE